MNSLNLKELFEEIKSLDVINLNKSFEISQICSQLLSDPITVHEGRELVIRMLDCWEKLGPETHELWNDLIEAAGLYPYLDKTKLKGHNILRHEFHCSKYLKDIYFHEEQMNLSLKLDSSESIIVSAPTSFGKSLLIEEIVASKKHKNIVIIQPTLALLDETRKKLKKYQDFYRIIVSTHQEPSKEANLFLLTAERVIEYENLPSIDFFVIDEFYKLSMDRDDERASVLNYAFYKLLKITTKFYLLGPNIASIPKGFEEDYKAKFIKSNFSTVAVDINEVESFLKKDKERKLFELLIKLKEPTLIYCSAPSKVNKLMGGFLAYCKMNNIRLDGPSNLGNLDLIEWIEKYVNLEWALKKALNSSVGIHHGALPRHISSSIVDYFNQGKIKYLFCTSTLIEGVNTTAKNVILFDKKKGIRLIDYFDFKNIVGRSGRMKKHFIGKIFQFYPEPPSSEIQVDIPFYTQNNAPSDLLIQLKPQDIKIKNSEIYKKIENLDPTIRELVKRNKGIPVEGQLHVIELIKKDLEHYHPLLSWSYPSYEQLKEVITLAWDNLLKSGESKGGIRSPAQLAFMTGKYAKIKSIAGFINFQLNNSYYSENELKEDSLKQKIINDTLQIIRHWFEYKLPKLLKTMSEIQHYVFSQAGLKKGNYNGFANLIENSFLPNNLTILLEYGVPSTAIMKLKKVIKSEVPLDQVIDELRKINLHSLGLINYEINKIKNIL